MKFKIRWKRSVFLARCWLTLLLSVKLTADAYEKVLEIFEKKKKSNNEPMGPHVIQGTPAFCLGQCCCWMMLERTVKNMPVWSLLFLDCTLYGRIKTATLQEEEADAFFVCLWKGGINVKIKKDELLVLTGLQVLKTLLHHWGFSPFYLFPFDKPGSSAGKVKKNVSCSWRENKSLEDGIKEHTRVHLRQSNSTFSKC